MRLWDFPRLQIAALLGLGLVGLLLTVPRGGRAFWAAGASGLAALCWQLLQVASYIPVWPVSVAGTAACSPGNAIRLLNANVLMDNRAYRPTLELVERYDPDLVLLLEPDQAWAEAIAPLHARYPYRLSEPLPNTYGLILLSKLPLEGAEVRHLLQPRIPSVKAAIRLRSGQTVDFYGIHPEPPLPGNDSAERDAELVLVGREVRDVGRAAIVMGDLNDVAWSHTSRLFQKVSGTRDPRVGRGPYPTYPANYWLLSWPLDLLFVSPHFKIGGMARLGDIGSDHRPMLFDLCLALDPDRRLVAPQEPAEVREDAREQVEEGLEERAEEDSG